MAKRSSITRRSGELSIRPAIQEDIIGIEDREEQFLASLDEPIIETTKLVLKKNLKLNTVGSETGNIYHFGGAGSVVDVNNRDVPKMLEMGLGGRCCGGSTSTPYFEVVR